MCWSAPASVSWLLSSLLSAIQTCELDLYVIYDLAWIIKDKIRDVSLRIASVFISKPSHITRSGNIRPCKRPKVCCGASWKHTREFASAKSGAAERNAFCHKRSEQAAHQHIGLPTRRSSSHRSKFPVCRDTTRSTSSKRARCGQLDPGR